MLDLITKIRRGMEFVIYGLLGMFIIYCCYKCICGILVSDIIMPAKLALVLEILIASIANELGVCLLFYLVILDIRIDKTIRHLNAQ